MRILLLTQWFNPEPTFKGLLFAQELMRQGHEVEVITGFPNYPGGKLYDGYKIRLLQRETMDGIPIIRVPLYPSHDNSGFRRFLNYASFASSAAFWGPLLAKPADVAYVYHPPGTIGLPAVMLKALRHIPFVYDIQDLWPDTIAATGMLQNQTAYRLLDHWLKHVYYQAAMITVLSPGFRDILISRGVPEKKIRIIYNWCDEACLQHHERDSSLAASLGFTDRFNVTFAGTMGLAQALDTVLEAATYLKKKLPRVQFVFVGGGVDVERLKRQASDLALPNVLFLPRQPISDIGRILAISDVLLVHLKDDPLFRITIPSKTQAYMVTGKPILMAVAGDAAALVRKAQAGLTCAPQDAMELARTIEKMASMSESQLQTFGDNGQRFYESELSFTVGVTQFLQVFEAVATQNR